MAQPGRARATTETRDRAFPFQQPWLTTVLDQVPSGVLIVDAASVTVTCWNEQATHTWPSFIQRPAALKGVSVCQLLRSDGHPYAEHEWPLARALATGTSVAEEIQFVAEDGTRAVVDVRCTAICDEGKPASAILVVLRDITEGQRVERALQESQARYENLYQDAPDMLASVDVDTELIVQCNQTLVRATGYLRDELLGRPMRDLHHPSCWRDLQAALDQVHAHGQVRDCELQVQCKNGSTIEVSLRIAAIRDEKGDLYFRSTWRDITVRKRVQTVLDLKQAELARSRLELQALAGRLFTAQEDERRRISRELHDDLNQRLAMLTLDIDGLSHRLPRSRQVTVERLQTLRDSVVELSDAVHTLAYKLHVSILEDLGLNVALESYLADFQRREAVQVDLRQEQLVGPVPPEVASCLYRVAQEAIRNVTRHASATHVTVSLATSDGGISLAIADDGVGFDAPTADHVGSRLGIVGMQERVRLVDGRFTLASQPGEGTHVDVWVPVPTVGA